MEGKKTGLIIGILNMLLVAACVAGCIYTLFAGMGTYYTIAAGVELLALVFSVLYFFFGYKKDAAKYYRLFMLFYAFTYVAEIFAGIFEYKNTGTIGVTQKVSYTIIVSMILYGNALILAVGNNIGKTASYILCGINIFAYALPVLAVVIPGLEIVSFESRAVASASIILYVTWLILAFNALLMTIAKYHDKDLRGTN